MAAVKFSKQPIKPNPLEVDYWVDITSNPYGGRIMYHNGVDWVDLLNTKGKPVNLDAYYNKLQVNQMLAEKASVDSVESKVDDSEIADIIKNIEFKDRGDGGIEMVILKYDNTTVGVTMPIASNTTSGIVTKESFKDFVKQNQLQQLYSTFYTAMADIRSQYQPRLSAGKNITIDRVTNTIHATGKISTDWNDLINVPDIDGAIKAEEDRAKTEEAKLSDRITDHVDVVEGKLDLKADKKDIYTKDQVDEKVASVYKIIGSVAFENLPTEGNTIGDVYNITNDFVLDDVEYPFGTNVVWTEDGWDTLSGVFDTTELEGLVEAVDTKVDEEVVRAKARELELDTKFDSYLPLSGGTITGNILQIGKNTNLNRSNFTICKNTSDSADYGTLLTNVRFIDLVAKSSGVEINYSGILYLDEDGKLHTVWHEGNDGDGSGLDADMLDGVHLATSSNDGGVTRSFGIGKYTTVNQYFGNGVIVAIDPYPTDDDALWLNTAVLSIGERKSRNRQLAFDYDSYTIKYRYINDIPAHDNVPVYRDWKTIAFTDSDITGNAGGLSSMILDEELSLEGYYNKYIRGKNISVSIANKNYGDVTAPSTILNVGTDQCRMFRLIANKLADLHWLTCDSECNYWSDLRTILDSKNFTNYALAVNATATNADKLDGKHASDFYDLTGGTFISNNSDLNDIITIGTYHTTSNENAETILNSPTSYAFTVQVSDPTGNSAYRKQTLKEWNASGKTYVRTYTANNNEWSTWYLTSTDLNTYNAPTATKLSTPVKLWGNDFDGSGNISGALSGVTSINNTLHINSSGNVTIGSSDLAGTDSKLYVNGAAVITGNTSLRGSEVNIWHNLNVGSTIATGNFVDWYGVSWSEDSSDPTCTRIGNMAMHRSLPILSAMKGYAITNNYNGSAADVILPMEDNWNDFKYGFSANSGSDGAIIYDYTNVMVKIPEFWYVDEYKSTTKTHNLKISQTAKAGWCHHKEAYVGAYEGYNDGTRYKSGKGVVPTVSVSRTTLRPLARANGYEDEAKWNIYTYEEHRAICHLFLVEYATRNSQLAVNSELTADGFRQGGLGSGCTTGVVTIGGATKYAFIPTGTTDSLGNGSGQVAYTVTQTDADGNETGTVTRYANRYRGIENPFGHIWKHVDDIVNVYNADTTYKTVYKCNKPEHFATNKNAKYKPLCAFPGNLQGWKKEIKATVNCDFFPMSVGGSGTTYWSDYCWDNTDTSEHCLLIGGGSSNRGGLAGLFHFDLYHGVGHSAAYIGSRLTYLPWAE